MIKEVSAADLRQPSRYDSTSTDDPLHSEVNFGNKNYIL